MGLKVANHYNVGKDNPMYGKPSPPKKKKHWNVGNDSPMSGRKRSGKDGPTWGMHWKLEHPPWNKGKQYILNGKSKHDSAVKEEISKLTKEGLKMIDLTKILPDAIAIDFQKQRVYAIEVETRNLMTTRKVSKYVDCTIYNDVIWILRK